MTTPLPENPLAYWGKANPAAGALAYHPLPYHQLDVAAVGLTYLERHPTLTRLFHQGLPGQEEEVLWQWIGFCLALHDLGKFSTTFQALRGDLHTLLQGENRPPSQAYTLRHDSLGWLLWRTTLRSQAEEEAWFGPDTDFHLEGASAWLGAALGHHGVPPVTDPKFTVDQLFTPADRQAAKAYVHTLGQLFPRALEIGRNLDPETFELASKPLSWWMAGLVVLADWVGSDVGHFPYTTPEAMGAAGNDPLLGYWPLARQRAALALEKTGLLPVPIQPAGFHDLFPQLREPSPLQAWADQVDLTPGPQILLLEDVTGAGKTEAALTLAQRLLAREAESGHGVSGFFVGLPTMATANAMYGRLAQVHPRQFAGLASLALAHGQKGLVETFAATVLPDTPPEADPRQTDATATARCTAWLADHNKRALLAPAGIGTIDQALLAGLKVRHQSLRLLGLLGKVLVVDEVHCCDAYVQRVLENLLTFHAWAGGSAILLSATLTQTMKTALVQAFAQGIPENTSPPTLPPGDFPLVTHWQAGKAQASVTRLPTRADVKRTLETRLLHDEAEVVTILLAAVEAGRCAVWMRNTVADVLAAQQLLKDQLPPERLTLFHARYALADRLAREDSILQRFGKDSTPAQRAAQLVICSQVGEQSLNIDFDIMVSDLAPMDRLIQRAGRLQRHPRTPEGARLTDPQARDQRPTPCLWVFSPPMTDTPGPRWYREHFPRAAKVYPHHGQLWLTARRLAQGSLRLPEDAREIMEEIFGPDAALPPGLEEIAQDVEGQQWAEESLAQTNITRLETGYGDTGRPWQEDGLVTSRLGDPSITVVLARWEDGQLRPWAHRPNIRHAWAYSSLPMARRRIATTATDPDPAREAQRQIALATLPDQGKWSVFLDLHPDGAHWIGTALDADGHTHSWRYHPKEGLMAAE